MDGRLFTFQLKLDRGASLHSLWHLVSKNLVSQAIWPRKPEMNAPRLLYVHPTPFIFSGTSGNGPDANSFAFKSVAAVVSDIPLGLPNSLYWVLGQDVLPGCWSYTTSRSDFGVYFLPLSPLCFVFFSFKNATIRTDIFGIEICRLSIWHFVKSIPGFPDSRYRLPCQMCTEYQTFPHPQPQHTAKGLL